ncbi:coenzyme F420-0:L-glutamate ligase [Halomonas organivorans]|uniref:Coenzyme F420-0:L-glutamate ligase/coenzyme F420-1:gamma-L-glutamate ligase n=1 Tax=Halomonas organivorans TaxID=257772 RepID=A0A7W5G6L9_9GAMM|nr:coenzyme F420-0:L-glutamate ligase [Halomonas organivorans]MBB3141636.1 coenzyme F420-0:L-glutamate ligase/coenzyme F420-1:gamma-L-glutamate ligase [Halomonas organivorans]
MEPVLEPTRHDARSGLADDAVTPQGGVDLRVLAGLPDIRPGDDLAAILIESLRRQDLTPRDGDILVIAHKVVSKAEGRVVALADVTPGDEARELAERIDKDPRKVEAILRESTRVVRAVKRPDQREGTLIAEHRLGFICANAAVDESNVGAADTIILLPEDPDLSARRLGERLEAAFGVRLGIVVTDTFGRPWRMGLVNVAIGLSRVPARVDLVGERDAFGRELSVTMPALADELAAASGLLMGKRDKTPVVLFRGVDWQPCDSSASELIRPQQEDLFR